MNKPLFEKSCGVWLSTRGTIKFDGSWGQYPGSGVTYVSAPFGRIKLFKEHLEIVGSAVSNDTVSNSFKSTKKFFKKGKLTKTIKISYKDIDYLYYKIRVIVIKHHDKKAPKNIWIASIFSKSLLKKIKEISIKEKLPVKFKNASQRANNFYEIVDKLRSIIFVGAAIIIFLIIAIIVFLIVGSVIYSFIHAP